ncbi:uncharacterized protein UV8b_02256 [Ustilaginoidea virens]|uniref:Uncharacterized protein n=1 Tax=Ustilaginoidea virens TaxID=1159556 RepID=A0A8E5HMK2_USTVR|nr:uncharacterized protein UV8b_02256 [Ustilaginoidea virens]QUC18015.1 hypothetical protein UV8b_02256 [Ustilaginoidea virens]
MQSVPLQVAATPYKLTWTEVPDPEPTATPIYGRSRPFYVNSTNRPNSTPPGGPSYPDKPFTTTSKMFGGFAPPQQSREEIRAMEAEATFTVQQVVATAFMLYLSPFAIDMASRIF